MPYKPRANLAFWHNASRYSKIHVEYFLIRKALAYGVPILDSEQPTDFERSSLVSIREDMSTSYTNRQFCESFGDKHLFSSLTIEYVRQCFQAVRKASVFQNGMVIS